jgi:lysophospholipase L1-like esterase
VARSDLWPEPFKKMVVMGESTVEGGPWLTRKTDRWVDVLARLIDACQENPIEYLNKGIGANAISPRSPGYADSAKPSALERYRADVIDHQPDLFVLCYGLNDMRAGMDVDEFSADMQTMIGEVARACRPLTVLTTVYYMTGWRSYPPYDRGSVKLTETYNDAIRELGRKNGCIVSNVWEAEGGADWLINPDGVHANYVGNLLIANRVFRDLAVNCSCLTRSTFKKTEGTKWVRDTMASRAAAGDPFVKTW